MRCFALVCDGAAVEFVYFKVVFSFFRLLYFSFLNRDLPPCAEARSWLCPVGISGALFSISCSCCDCMCVLLNLFVCCSIAFKKKM